MSRNSQERPEIFKKCTQIIYGSVLEELSKTFQDGAHANDFFDLGKNDQVRK